MHLRVLPPRQTRYCSRRPLITAGHPVRSSAPSPSCNSPGFETPPPHRPTHCNYLYCRPAVRVCPALLISATRETITRRSPNVYSGQHRFPRAWQRDNRPHTADGTGARPSPPGYGPQAGHKHRRRRPSPIYSTDSSQQARCRGEGPGTAGATSDVGVTRDTGPANGRPPIEVHVGGCYAAGKRRHSVPRDEARRLLTSGVRACTHCKPDAQLRILS
ncbi:DUF6233 domain-containing protein [Streptomyces mirabilis]|uniref:DUF6233 domain-containing protein n=1 Tax=Streptomyces mirabilis TaxID=68239 RepID=UPI0036901030